LGSGLFALIPRNRRTHMGKPANVVMEKNGVQTEVANNESVQIMSDLGWKQVPAEPKKKSEKEEDGEDKA
jgi:hypothetical protein